MFDQRMAGEDANLLIGTPGLESEYKLKNAIKRIKSGALFWSQSHPDFLLRVQRMMDSEARTIAKRFSRIRTEPARHG